MAPEDQATTGPLSQSRELKLQRLVEAGMLLNQELSLDAVLARIVEVAQHLLEAKYAALGVLADDKTTLKNFVTIGVSEDERRAIGPLPTGKGILGAMLSEGHPLRLSDLNADPRSAGCPFPHPQMTSFLGVPILWRGQVFGRLYVTDKRTAETFSVEDEEIATMLAAQAAIAIENANLYERAQEANRMKSEFLANMSHELRTPMNSILGFTELVMNGTLGPVNEKQQQSLQRVLRNGHHLLELINDVLDLSKIEAGKMTLTESEFSPEALLAAAWSTIEPMAGQKGLSARLDLAGAPAVVRGDEGKLRQVVLNLLSNAVKFTDAGTIGIRAEADEDTYLIHVSDTGVGISAENLGLIFEEFRQVDASSTRQAGGTGLGLAISRKMTQLMGGDISVVSTVGKGSTFTIRLPRASGLSPASAVTVAPTPASMRPAGLVVLAIDDDPEVLELMTSRLANTEFGVVTAQSGEAGLKLAQEIKP
ncbi:MAG: ATP-binding protein, partial [Candidatus Sericytochromatia bacterium]